MRFSPQHVGESALDFFFRPERDDACILTTLNDDRRDA